MIAVADALAGHPLVDRSVSLARMTTYRFGGAADYVAEVTSTEELRTVLEARSRTEPEPPLLVLGRGSNVVVSDAGFHGLVLRLSGVFNTIEVRDSGLIWAGAAVPLPTLARRSVAAGRGGLEWCVGIPGSVGGAVKMNAGGHGSDVAAWIESAEILDGRSGEVASRPAADLGLRYRSSGLQPDDVVLSAVFKSTRQSPQRGLEMLREITRWRREHQPGGALTAGSVFKNPPGDSAGRIIDALGLKGFRVGGAFVSLRHANFFEADRGASAQDVFDLVEAVKDRVLAQTGTRLEPEIRFIGAFHRREEGVL